MSESSSCSRGSSCPRLEKEKSTRGGNVGKENCPLCTKVYVCNLPSDVHYLLKIDVKD